MESIKTFYLLALLNYSNVRQNSLRFSCALQIERHPYFRNDKTVEWCEANDIHVSAYSPLGSPDSKLLMKRKLDVNLLTHPLVEEIARRLNKNPGQVGFGPMEAFLQLMYHLQNTQ